MQILLFHLEDFEEMNDNNKIGEGGQGIVYKLHELKTQQIYALKIFQGLDSSDIFIHEINTITKLSHPALIQLYGTILNPCCLIMDYCPNKTVDHYIQKVFEGETLNDQELQHWNYAHKLIIILGISFGMEYLHSQKVVHRDLKPGNVLLDSNFYPKICDFGLAKDLTLENSMTGNIGTPLYGAPEQLTSSNYDGKKADVYSFGMTLYSILLDQPPYARENFNAYTLYEKIKSSYRPKIEQGKISPLMEELITKCWDSDSDLRPSFEEISRELLIETERIFEMKELADEEMKEIHKFITDICKRDFEGTPSSRSIQYQLNKFEKEYKDSYDYQSDPDGFSPLHYAATKNLKDIVELLISKGADINAKDIKYLRYYNIILMKLIQNPKK